MTDTYMVPNPPTPNKVLAFDKDICIGCNRCVEKEPIVMYPEECWFCGGCVEECPAPGAITLVHPTQQRISVNWKRRDTGELFRLGMKNPPEPNTRPPSGGR